MSSKAICKASRCAGTLFVLMLKFGAILNIICGYERLFDGGFILEAYTAMHCYRAVFSEVAKTTS